MKASAEFCLMALIISVKFTILLKLGFTNSSLLPTLPFPNQ